MAVQTQVVRFQKTTAGSNGQTQDVNLNFTPKAVIVISEGKTSDNIMTDHFSLSYGFSDGTNQACVAVVSEDAAATSDTGRIHYNNRVYARLDTATPATVRCEGSIVFATNKVTFTWDVQEAVATYIGLIAIGGDDITNAKVNTVDIGTTGTGNTDYTGLGFTVPQSPNGVLFTLTGDVTTINTAAAGASIGYCTAVSATKRTGQGQAMEDNVGVAETWRLSTNDKCLVNLDAASGAKDYEADFVDWITDGFRLNITDAAGTTDEKFSYLVIRGGTWDVGQDSGRNTTGTKSTTVAVNSETLRSLIIYSVESALANYNTVAAECRYGIGFSDGTNEFQASGADDSGQTNMFTITRNTDNGRILNVVFPITGTATNFTNFIEASFDSFGTNQFTLNHTTVQANSDVRYFIWIVVADGFVAPEVVTTEEISFKSFGTIGLTNSTGNTIFG